MAKISPTSRSLKLLRDSGYFAQVVERWNPHAFIRQDLFGWIDIVAVHPGVHGVLGVQTTSGSNLSARMQKAHGNAALVAWLTCGGTLQAHGWRKLKNRWQVDCRPIGMVDLVRDLKPPSSGTS